MNDAKYIGMDVHQATISIAVRDARGNLVMEAILETKAETILQFIRGLRGSLYVTFEEGTWAAWLHDLLQPHVTRVCDPRKNALLKVGNKNDRIDARKLSELLYLNKLSPVYHGEPGNRTLKELARSYIAITRDLTRVIFVNGRGRPFSANKLREKQLHPLLDALGIPRGGFHSMRHGAASSLLAEDATPAVVQKQLRHSDARITLGIYGHVVGDASRPSASQNNRMVKYKGRYRLHAAAVYF
jgi:integrase-like protein